MRRRIINTLFMGSYTGLYSGRVIPLLFLMLGILAVYWGSFWWVFGLLIISIMSWYLASEVAESVYSKGRKLTLYGDTFDTFMKYLFLVFYILIIFITLLPMVINLILIAVGILFILVRIWITQIQLKKIVENLHNKHATK